MWPEIWSLRYAILYTHVQYHLNKSQFFFHDFVNENHGNCAEYLTCANINFTVGFICICMRPKFLKYIRRNPHSVFLNSRFYHNVQFCLIKVCNLGVEFHLCKILVNFVLKCADPQRKVKWELLLHNVHFSVSESPALLFQVNFFRWDFYFTFLQPASGLHQIVLFYALSTVLLT